MDKLALAGFANLLVQYGRKLRVLDDTGESFQAIVANAPSVDPNVDLGSDPRELCRIECLNSDCPDALSAGDALSQIQLLDMGPVSPDPDDLGGWTWKLVRRESSNSDFVTAFWATKVVAGIDT